MKSLSVGCNGNRECEFNTDIKLYVKKDLACNGLNLPFTDNSFDIVYSSHVLEHVVNPYLFMQELKRVAKKAVIIKIPNSPHYKKCQLSGDHIYGWSIFELNNFLRLFFEDIKVYGSMRIVEKNKLKTLKTYLISFLSREPNELTAICRKQEVTKQDAV